MTTSINNFLDNFSSIIPAHIRFLLSVYGTGILFFTLFRVFLLIVNWQYAEELPVDSRISLLLTSFWYGFRFDSVISGYILILPFIILTIFSFFKKNYTLPYFLILFLIIPLYITAFIVTSINIPYFKYYFANTTSVILNWVSDFSFIVRMIAGDLFMVGFVILFLLLSSLFVYIVRKFYRKTKTVVENTNKFSVLFLVKRLFLFIFFFLLIFLAIRGRIEEKSPIRVGTAYFSEYSFANQLGLNPVFTLLTSMLEDSKLKEQRINFIDDQTAIEYSRKFLGIGNEIEPAPISRKIIPKGEGLKQNVIVVIMESMAAVRMNRYGNNSNLTPVLDSLAENAITFDNFFTSGIHTYNGVYSTLFSFPTILNRHPMKPAVIPRIHTIVNELKKNNYRNYFFVAHDDQFDNTAGFLYENGFEKIFCERNYPSEWILSTLGVPDHILFDETVNILNEVKDNRPFFAAILTASNHDPKIIPPGINFTPTASSLEEQLVQYCDWSIKHFLQKASQSDWYENTIFVFLADHGRSTIQPYDIPLSFFHSPLIFFSERIKENPMQYDELAMQIDVMPTIIGMLNLPYINSTMGIDLLLESRSFAYFTDDNNIGVLSDRFFLIKNRDGGIKLHEYKTRSIKNFADDYPEVVDSMLTYTHSMLQSTQYIIENYSLHN